MPLCSLGQYLPDRKIPLAEIIDIYPVSIYKEPTTITKIAELPPKEIVFVLGEGKLNSFYIYRKGVVGYIPGSKLIFDYGTPTFYDEITDKKLEDAKKEEIKFDMWRAEKTKNNRIEDSLNNLKFKKDGVSLTNPEFIEGFIYCGFDFSITNYTNKTIKYFHLTISAYNPVHDFVTAKRFTYVGPILNGDNGHYEDKYAFSNDHAISYYRIKKLEIEYTNGSKKEWIGESLKSAIVF